MVVSPVIDTGLILAALYLVLSVVVSNVNEQIASLFHWRGNLLYSGVRNLLSGAEELTKALFSHPLIASSQYNKDGRIKAGETYRPSYIDARNFSLALAINWCGKDESRRDRKERRYLRSERSLSRTRGNHRNAAAPDRTLCERKPPIEPLRVAEPSARRLPNSASVNRRVVQPSDGSRHGVVSPEDAVRGDRDRDRDRRAFGS